ncbi:hypothetical protein [Halomicrococcus sp. NG-SE-24]|uniref:hypothetical protein n=1 Tax=Halomicrococcus sp. NG-SE-24 TaxID=3436928 RepID=UPI003D96192C
MAKVAASSALRTFRDDDCVGSDGIILSGGCRLLPAQVNPASIFMSLGVKTGSRSADDASEQGSSRQETADVNDQRLYNHD